MKTSKGRVVVLRCSIFWLFISIHGGAPRGASGYQILGGGDPPPGSEERKNEVTETLRHLNNMRVTLNTQSHEAGGRVSMAGTLWEAGPVLADYITNPACPVDALRRLHGADEDDSGPTMATATNMHPLSSWQPLAQVQSPQSSAPTVVELGAGIGMTSLAAALIGCRVVATDGEPSSVRLSEANFLRYQNDCPIPPQAAWLYWGDDDVVREFIGAYLGGRSPDVVMAGDVVYANSAREELARTIRMLCGTETTVILAHRWRMEIKEEEAFFRSFDDDFDRIEVPEIFLPPGDYFRRRSTIDGKFPISIFGMRRKQ